VVRRVDEIRRGETMNTTDIARNRGGLQTRDNGGAFLTMTATAIVYLAPWGSETGTILAGLWTSLLAFCLIDRSLVRPYLYPAAHGVLLVFPGLQDPDRSQIDQKVAVECEKTMSHTACSHPLTLDQLSLRMDQPEEKGAVRTV
jgi:hypothetical protein